MPVITATEVTIYSNISTSAATIAASGRIAIVQQRINWICNNYFETELYYQAAMTFNATARTVTVSGGDWPGRGFAAGDEVYIYHSYRNDGYYTTSSVSGSVLTFATGATVVDELSGRSILVSVVKWPEDVKQTAALMVEYDTDMRKKKAPGLLSRTLGPLSETYAGVTNNFGYPEELIAPLYDHRVARLM